MKYECLVAMVLIGCVLARDSLSATPHFDEGIRLERNYQWEQAYQAFVRSLEAGEQPDSPKGPAWHALSMAAEHLGKLHEGLTIAEKELQRQPNVRLYMLTAHFYMGRLKQFEKARDLYQKAADLAVESGDFYRAALSCNSMARSYCMEAEDAEYFHHIKIKTPYLREAEAQCTKALALCDRIDPADGDPNFARRAVLQQLIDIYDWPKYNELYDPEKARGLKEQVEVLSGGKIPRSAFSETLQKADQLAAEKRHDEAAQLLESLLVEDGESETQIWLGDKIRSVYMAGGNLEKAYEASRQNIDRVNRVRAKLTSDAEKTAFAQGGVGVSTYEWAVDLATRLKRHEEALEYIEMGKARAMLDVMAAGSTAAKEELIDKEVRERDLLMAKADEIRKPIEQERQLGRSEQAESLQRSLVLVEDHSEAIRARVDNLRREVKSATAVETLSADEIRQLIGDASLIEIYLDIHAAVVTPGKVTAYELRGRGRMREQLRKFRDAIQAQGSASRTLDLEQDSAREAVAADLLAPAQQLYNILIRPIERTLTTDRIYIVVDRSLAGFPFHALHDGQQYFGEKHTLVYAPSVSVLKYCVAKRKPMTGRIVAFGNPNLRDARYRLVHAEDEVKALAPLFPQATILLGNDANEMAVRLLGGDADILHFACHTRLNEDDPALSALMLSPAGEDDGLLHAAEIFNLNLNAGLVTLSACESIQGRNPYGTEMLGLTRAVMFAGAPSVLGSLWRVDDRSTSRLMVDFYENLQTMNKAEALRAAQVGMIKEGFSPFHWAAFCLYGDYL